MGVEIRSPEGNGTFWPLLGASLITSTPSGHILLDQLDSPDSWRPEQVPAYAQLELNLIV